MNIDINYIQVKMVDSVLTPEECGAICWNEVASAFLHCAFSNVFSRWLVLTGPTLNYVLTVGSGHQMLSGRFSLPVQ